MWDENKSRRFEYLRQREGQLTDAEQAELAALLLELENGESAYETEATQRKRRERQKRKENDNDPTNWGAPAVISRIAGAASIIAGIVATLGTVLKGIGISFLPVSRREPGIDVLQNHLFCFGPLVLVCWCAVIVAKPRILFVAVAAFATFFWILGFCE